MEGQNREAVHQEPVPPVRPARVTRAILVPAKAAREMAPVIGNAAVEPVLRLAVPHGLAAKEAPGEVSQTDPPR